ncbi:hypothetical protein NN561_009144 [Cricetulus griseus]
MATRRPRFATRNPVREASGAGPPGPPFAGSPLQGRQRVSSAVVTASNFPVPPLAAGPSPHLGQRLTLKTSLPLQVGPLEPHGCRGTAQEVLIYEPENPVAKEFFSLIEEILLKEKAQKHEEDDEDSEEDTSSESEAESSEDASDDSSDECEDGS